MVREVPCEKCRDLWAAKNAGGWLTVADLPGLRKKMLFLAQIRDFCKMDTNHELSL